MHCAFTEGLCEIQGTKVYLKPVYSKENQFKAPSRPRLLAGVLVTHQMTSTDKQVHYIVMKGGELFSTENAKGRTNKYKIDSLSNGHQNGCAF